MALHVRPPLLSHFDLMRNSCETQLVNALLCADFAFVLSGNLRRDVFGSTFPGMGICAFDAGGIRVGGPCMIAPCTTALIFHFDLTGNFVQKANLIFGLFERQI